MRYFLTLWLIFIAAPALAGDSDPLPPRKIAQAGKPKPGEKPAPKQPDKPTEKSTKPNVGPVGEQLEADVLEFVREHHPELADLLAQLEDNRPKEYQKAIRDLARVRERLFAMQKNDNGRYAIELSIWKAETRIQLLAARLHMGDNTELRDQLREALGEQVDLRLSLLKHERDITKERVEKLDAQIRRLDEDRSAAIDKQLQSLVSKPKNEKSGSDKPVKTIDKPKK